MLSNARNFRSVALLALLLVVGPLQAQALFACNMMAATLQECCCDDIEAVPERTAGNEAADPCCERIVEIRSDPDAVEAVKPVEVRSDVDPPPGLPVQQWDVITVVIAYPVAGSFGDSGSVGSGRQIYLTTQRLRL